MAEFIFTSPGIKFKEADLPYVSRNVGITTLGLVGETLKGPAFEPVPIAKTSEFRTKFGLQSIEKFASGSGLKYQLPYVANAYLEESNQLWVTRVLGLSGYDAGTGWAITLKSAVDLTTTGTSATEAFTDNFTDSTYLGETITTNGQDFSVFSGFVLTSESTFEGTKRDFTVTSLTNGSGTVEGNIITVTGTTLQEYDDMILAVIRSKGVVEDVVDSTPITKFDIDKISILSNTTKDGTGNLLGNFIIKAENITEGIVENYVVSLNPNSKDYITNVIGNKPKGGKSKIWVESIFPDLIKKLDADSLGHSVNTTVLDLNSDVFTNYKQQFQTPETPYIVSEVRGNTVERLFKFIMISDGDSANKEIKISFANIDPLTREFDIIIRDFNDTDDNIIVLESFTKCSMRKGDNSYIGNKIGTTDGQYDLKSSYVMLDINEDASNDAFPAGFEGYYFKDFSVETTGTLSAVAGKTPKIYYNTSYNSSDKVNRVYLGISEKAYSGVGLNGNGFNPDMFNYKGQGGFVQTKGFHMDSDAALIVGDVEFEVGSGKFQTFNDVNNSANPYNSKNTRKFTVVPAGGFDGWDVHRLERSNGDLYRPGGAFDGVDNVNQCKNDFVAWETAIRTFANPEEVTINIFATPGINWLDNLILVERTIDMIEQERADSLYIIDSPNLDNPLISTTEKIDVIAAKEIVGALNDTGVDSNYSATYYPWIQIRDSDNNVNIFIPPTGEVVKSIAYTDKVKFPWWAPAGLQRGVTDARKAKYKMSEEAKGLLYSGRINPMVDFTDVGTAIWGQKTLQVKQSPLDRINVRRLLLQIKVLISNVAIRLIFDQNDESTVDQFLSKVNPILDTIKRERGLEKFDVKMESTPESRDRYELIGEINLTPTKSLENIGIKFNVSPSGASFENI